MAVTDFVSGMIENVRRSEQMPKYYDQTSKIWSKVEQRAEVVPDVNRQFYRIPIETLPPGDYGKVAAVATSGIGTGDAHVLQHLTVGYFVRRQTFRLDDESVWTTNSNASSVADAMGNLLANCTSHFRTLTDIHLHLAGDNILTNASSAKGTNTLTFAAATDMIRTNRLREGLKVDYWNGAGTTNRGSARIQSINRSTHTVTVDAEPGGAAAGDILAIQGSDAYGPSSLTTHSATYPSSIAAGIGGDSGMHGLDYYFDTNDANYVLGIQKSALPQYAPKAINANSNLLTYYHAQRLYTLLQRNRDDDNHRAMEWIFPLEQRDQIQVIQMAHTVRDVGRANNFGGQTDLLPEQSEYDAEFPFGHAKACSSKRMREDRLYLVDWAKWGKVVPRPLDFYRSPDGQTIFPVRVVSGSDAQPAFGWTFTLYCADDLYTVDPGCQGMIYNLALPNSTF